MTSLRNENINIQKNQKTYLYNNVPQKKKKLYNKKGIII
jgi:hypothetical protein